MDILIRDLTVEQFVELITMLFFVFLFTGTVFVYGFKASFDIAKSFSDGVLKTVDWLRDKYKQRKAKVSDLS